MPLMTSQSQIKGLAQSSTPDVIPEGSLWYDTSNNILKASDGSSYNQIGKTNFAGAAVVSHSTTIGDYTTPTSAVISSLGIQAAFSDAYTTNTGWTLTGTKVNVDSTVADGLSFNAIDGDDEERATKSLGFTLNDTQWRADLTFKHTAVSSGENIYLALLAADTSLRNDSGDGLGFGMGDNGKLIMHARDGATLTTNYATAAITPVINTFYYASLERTSTTNLRLSIYTDSGRTTHLTGSPENFTIPSTITTLTLVSHQTYNTGVTARTLTAQGDDLAIYSPNPIYDNDTATLMKTTSQNNPNIYVDMGSALNLCAVAIYHDAVNTTETEIKIQSSSDAITWTDKRKITVSNLTGSAWNYYRFNIAGGARYIRIYGTGTSKVLSTYEVKVLKKTDAEIFADLGTVEISNSDTTLDGDGV